MAQKVIIVPELGEVTLQKRRGLRSIRLTVAHDGTVRVSMPSWSPYSVGEAFVRGKTAWVLKQRVGKGHDELSDNERIGKAHRLRFVFEARQALSTRITDTEIIIKLPEGAEPIHHTVQAQARAAAIRALKQEAKVLLPQRLNLLATKHGFDYRSVTIKHLKARWGSCSTHKDIALNCFLMQLPWDLIDYVLLHELVHTRIMAHGKPFWDELAKYVRDLPAKRKAIRAHQPNVITQG